MGHTKLDRNRIITSIKLLYNDDNSVIYPIIVSSTLKILNLGYIEYERQNFHSVRNLIPIGFKSVRVYSSMFYKDRRCEYTCEILDNMTGPQYMVTSEEDPQNPIIRDASSAAWIVVC